MRKSRRQIANRIIETLGVGLVVLDLVVFFAIYRPLGGKLDALVSRDARLREAVRTEERRLDLLQKYEAAFPDTDKELQEFTRNRVPSRREAFSVAAHLIHKVASAAGVNVTTLIYRLDSEHHEPLQRLSLDISLQGPYAGLLKFAHDLETANDFMLIRQFSFTPGGQDAPPGAGAPPIALRLMTDLYLNP